MKLNIDNDPILLNPNCSECIWRLKGSSQRYEGSNQVPIQNFIIDILKIFVDKEWDLNKALTAIPIYISGDGGPDTLDYAFLFTLDLLKSKRSPLELSHPDFDDQIWEKGYYPEDSVNWKSLILEIPAEEREYKLAETLLDQIKQKSKKKRKTKKKN